MGRTRFVESTISAHYAPVKRWRVRLAIIHPPRSIAGFSIEAANGLTPTSSMVNFISSKFEVFRRIRSRRTCVAGWERKIRKIRSIRSEKGALIDQLLGQYLAHVTNLGPLVSPAHIHAALQSIYKYNYKRTLVDHDNVERTFALNNEAAMVICDYGDAPRPRIPFPYFAEVMTGFEHAAAALMIYSGMVDEGIECIHNIRARYDGEKRSPWDEAECGHHYARAMASWTSFVALSGFQYDGAKASVVAVPRVRHKKFNCFWSTATGWGTFSYLPVAGNGTRFTIEVLAGKLACRSCSIMGAGSSASAQSNGKLYSHSMERRDGNTVLHFDHPIQLSEGRPLRIELAS